MKKQINHLTYGILAASLLATGIAVVSTIVGGTEAKAAGRVGPWDAMAAATAKVGGKAIQATYVNEGGKFIYDVVVVKGKTLMEVEVDAATGKAGSTETVTPEEEAKEFAEDLHKALGHTVKPTAGEKGEADEKDK